MVKLSDLPGRKALKKRLNDEVLTGHTGHAYILEGPMGCGKESIAKAFAYAILCMSKGDIKPCGSCKHCSVIEAGGHGELYELVSEKNTISINAIRELQQNINLIPVSGDRKVYIVNDADNMTIAAQNGILKTLEEPPNYATILLTVTNYDRLIDTIKSRAVLLQIGINSIDEIEEHLIKTTDYEPEEIKLAARCSNGSLGRALDIVGSKDFETQRSTVIEFTDYLLSKQFEKAYDMTAYLAKNSKNILYPALSGLLRDMLVLKTTKDLGYLINRDKKDIIIKGSERYPEHILSRIISIINDSSDRTASNAAVKQTMDAMIVKITEELAGW